MVIQCCEKDDKQCKKLGSEVVEEQELRESSEKQEGMKMVLKR
jgi:hypothetical protein